MAIEIVSFPMKKMVIFDSYVNVYQRVYLHGWIQCFEDLLVFIRHFLIFKARNF